MRRTKLGINIDHVATLRQARFTTYPDPATAAVIAEKAGCDSIVTHLRKDQRHIQKEDVFLIKDLIKIPFNLEMSIAASIVSLAETLKPDQATLVPENRKELTTEGGIDLVKNYKKVEKAVNRLKKKKIKVSLFIDPIKKQIKAAKDLGVEIVEINTGQFSQKIPKEKQKKELERIKRAALFAKEKKFFVAAGHGLDYENIKKIVEINEIQEFNIGHSIICESIFLGLAPAVKKMLSFLKK
ncbi:MAG: pyridoxine 5'-phosphate synthase [Candidatus Omnitrophica bacterium]|nr:pyridoxine 5'-phosphate synthase [Candidatus Omnitrophota bacterium]MCF7894445.1 pyridoxine 5'-phosphate synthase [Candidatus Omnitrophota bacterium]